MNTSDINWNIENTNNKDDFLNIQNEIFQKFDVLNDGHITQLFLNNDIDKNVFDEIYKKAESVCKLNYIFNNEDSIECVLAIILLKVCDGGSDYWNKIDKIEYYLRFFKWTIREYIKQLKKSDSYAELIKQLIDSSVSTINFYVDNKVNLNTTNERVNSYYQRTMEDWNNDSCFSKLWQDRDFENLSWEGNKTAFFSLYILDRPEFIKQIAKFQDPYSIKMALHAIDSEVDFSDWCDLLNKTEKSFEEEGTFHSNKLLSPLFLYLADYKINTLIHSYSVNTLIEKTQLDELCSKIDAIILSIVQFLSLQNRDFLLHRWTLYQFMEIRNKGILRDLEKQPDQVPDVHLYARSRWVLSYIEKKQSFITNNEGELQIWQDKLDYEDWYQYVLFSMWSSEKDEKNISTIANHFFKRWFVDNKTWYKEKGQIFRKQSEKFNFYGNYFENEENKYYYTAVLLFHSIQGSNSLDEWKKLLASSEVFFDILSYQKYRSGICEFDNTQESTSYLKLLCIVGIHTLDILVQESHEYTEDFYSDLYNLIFKCYRIKYSKSDRLWISFIKQMMLRRILYSKDSESSEITALETMTPTLANYLAQLRGKHIELFDVLYFLDSNEVHDELIVTALDDANINLSKLLEEFNRLQELDKKNYDISKDAQSVIAKYTKV